jgi:hypothetical protein
LSRSGVLVHTVDDLGIDVLYMGLPTLLNSLDRFIYQQDPDDGT